MVKRVVGTTTLSVRLPQDLYTDFKEKAKRFGKPAFVLRELMSAFVESRLTITPPTTKGTIYDTRN
jgi:predicted DNA-binding protein